MTDQTQSPPTPAWQQAADPKLVRWLWRQLERPGLLQQQHAHQLLARHQGMVAGLPLATALHRRAAIGADPQAAQASIVYVTPPAWSPPALAATPTVEPTTAQLPVVTAALPAARPVSQPTLTLPATETRPDASPRRAMSASQTPGIASPAPATPAGGPAMVIQRKAMPGAGSTAPALQPTTPPVVSAPSTVGSAPAPRLGALPLPPRRSGALGGVVSDPRRPPSFSQAAPLPPPVVNASRLPADLAVEPGATTLTPALSRLVLETADQTLPAVSLPSQPVVRARVARHEPRDPALLLSLVQSIASPTHAANATSGGAATLVVREQSQQAESARAPMSLTRPAEPLPLVVVTPHASPGTQERHSAATPTTDARGGGGIRPRPSLLAARTAGLMNTATGAAERQHKEDASPPAFDIDGIVDKVHRKFLQTLALEGERRGRS